MLATILAILALGLALAAFLRGSRRAAREEELERATEEANALRARVQALEVRLSQAETWIGWSIEHVGRLEAGAQAVPEARREPQAVPAAPEPVRPPESILSPEPIPWPLPVAAPEPAAPQVVASAAPAIALAAALAPEPDAPVALPGPVEEPPRRSWNVEDLLGSRVFLKVGVAIVLIGVVLFLGYAVGQLGAAGKVLIGVAVGATLLGGGAYAERRPSYRVIGRSLLAGGFGILYFVAFATHYLPAARLIDSPTLATALLLGVGGSAVAFSLRYRHEWTTVFAFGLMLLTLLLAALQPVVSLNLVASTIVGGALAVVAWRAGWHRLLALGAGATWLTTTVFIAVMSQQGLDGGAAGACLLLLGLLWLGFELAVALPRAPRPDERFPTAALLVNAGFALALSLVVLHQQDQRLRFLAPLVLGVAYLVQAYAFRRQERRWLYLVAGTLALCCLGLVSPLRLGFSNPWVPVLRLIGLQVVLASGIWLRERYFRLLAYLAFGITAIQLLGTPDTPLFGVGVPLSLRGLAWALAAGVALANVLLLARRWREVIGAWEVPAVGYGFSALLSLFTAALCLVLRPEVWGAGALGAVAVVHALVATRYRRVDFLWECVALCGLAVVLLLDRNSRTGGGAAFSTPLALGALAATAALYGAYARLARAASAHEADGPGILLPWISTAVAGLGWVAVTAMAYAHVPRPWAGACLALSAVLHLATARHTGRREILVLGLLHGAISGVTVSIVSLPILGSALALQGRLLTTAAAILLLFLAAELVRRSAGERSPALAFVVDADPRALDALELCCLAVPTGLLAALVKLEALGHHKNLAVALALMVMALLYFRVDRWLRSFAWAVLGHALVVLATVHLFAVNFLQPGHLGPFSLRALTVIPFLLALAWIRVDVASTIERLPAEVARLAPAYLYAAVAVLATFLLYELQRAWVVVGWALLGLGCLALWLRAGDLHLRIAAVLLALATVVRALGTNLTLQDVRGNLALNLVVLPLAAAALLGCYLLVRLAWLRRTVPSEGAPVTAPASIPGWLDWGRLSWLFACLTLVTAFVWVESQGTLLTVALSLEGFAVVGLGIWLRERIARLTGITLLSFCVLKLFVYDLRGLSGLPRIASFVVLGVVLIAVSVAYARFREHLKDLL